MDIQIILIGTQVRRQGVPLLSCDEEPNRLVRQYEKHVEIRSIEETECHIYALTISHFAWSRLNMSSSFNLPPLLNIPHGIIYFSHHSSIFSSAFLFFLICIKKKPDRSFIFVETWSNRFRPKRLHTLVLPFGENFVGLLVNVLSSDSDIQHGLKNPESKAKM